MEDMTLFYKHYALGISVTKLKCMACWMQQSMAFWCLFNSSTKKADCIDVVLGHSSLEATSERFSKEKVLFDYWDKSWIWGFSNAYGIKVMAKFNGVTY